jgi:predicted membrane protein
MNLILECVVICFILLVSCVVAIANGAEKAAFLYEKEVQDRVVQRGLVTRERLNRNRRVFKIAGLTVMAAFVLWAVYGINGARGFWQPFW